MNFKKTDTMLVILVGIMLVTLAFFVRTGGTADRVGVFKTDGITCDGCVAEIEKALKAKKGIASMEVDIQGGRVIVGYDSMKIEPAEIAGAIAGSGYRDKVSQVMSMERFRAITGREPENRMHATVGCGGCSFR
jgi:copper chaperone CopZ